MPYLHYNFKRLKKNGIHYNFCANNSKLKLKVKYMVITNKFIKIKIIKNIVLFYNVIEISDEILQQ